MRSLILISLLVFSTTIFCQSSDATITDLRGFEDKNGNTHLFYRINTITGNGGVPGGVYNDIYHFDLNNSVDTLFLHSGSYEDSTIIQSDIVNDIEFWHNDPTKYVYCGRWFLDYEGGSYVKRYDDGLYGGSIFYNGAANNIELSKQNDSLLYLPYGLLKSTDGGHSWQSSGLSYPIVSLSPYHDNEFYAMDKNNFIMRSADCGKVFEIVDSTFSLSYQNSPVFGYDMDSLHVYRVSYVKDGENLSSYFSSSPENGIKGSWNKKYTSSRPVYFSVDMSVSGTIYLADSNKVLILSDYGNKLNIYRALDSIITGIYKKPGSDKLYVSTNKDIYEITNVSIKSIKHLTGNKEVYNYYPLHVGDTWVYSGTSKCVTWGTPSDMVRTRKVIDKEIKSNNKTYFKIEETYYLKGIPHVYYYERVDTSSGRIFRYNADSTAVGSEYVVDDLNSSKGDTVFSQRYINSSEPFFVSEYDTTITNTRTHIKAYANSGLEIWHYGLAKGLGLAFISAGDDNRCFDCRLQGAVVNGIVYGDTTITAVDKDKNKVFNFALYQNYPNPFNPSTAISYEIPKSGLVQLKVFDILGREVTAIVNEYQTAGEHTTIFKLQQANKQLVSGIYLYRLKFGGSVLSRKMILIK